MMKKNNKGSKKDKTPKQKMQKKEKLLGKCLKKARKSRGMTQTEIASQLEIAQPTYANYEAGLNRCPATVLLEVSKILDMSVESILAFEDENEKLKIVDDAKTFLESLSQAEFDELVDHIQRKRKSPENSFDYPDDDPSLKWAILGEVIASCITEQGQKMIEQFTNSIIANPAFMRTLEDKE